jgi:hypothetical protein
MMPHNYGSTALAGLEYYSGSQFPEAYQQSFYLGDVVKSRVYRATIAKTGTTPVPNWEPEFIVSDDPWFRPVDVKLGPDGALYIADFYNRIIGHYEVALDHPGRDHQRGRIWRVTYEANASQHQPVNWLQAELSDLIAGLKEPGITVRMMVADQIVDRYGDQAAAPIMELLKEPGVSSEQFVHGMWILFRLDRIDRELIDTWLAHNDDLVRIHLLRILFEMQTLENTLLDRIRQMTEIENAHIRRAAVMILAKHPSYEQVEILLDREEEETDGDTHLKYALKQALRDHLREPEILAMISQEEWDSDRSRLLAQAILGVDNVQSAEFLLEYLENLSQDEEQLVPYVNHIARLLPESGLRAFQNTLKNLTSDDHDLQYKVIVSFQNGIAQKAPPGRRQRMFHPARSPRCGVAVERRDAKDRRHQNSV